MAWMSAKTWNPFEALHRCWRVRRMSLALGALDGATLKDIGDYRREIDSIARGTV